jgi:transcriptional regulator with XRE-family HTH domain
MTEIGSARLNKEIVRLYGKPEAFRLRVLRALETYGISKRKLAIRSGLNYQHVLKVLNAKVTPRLETMLLLDEALEQLIEDEEEV